MKRFSWPWLVAAVGLLSSFPCWAQPAPGDLEVTARALVTALSKDDYAAATKDFDDTMLKVMPADKLGKTWKDVQGQVGAFKKLGGARTEKVAKFDAVMIVCEFEKMNLEARVVFSADKKVSGLQFRPAFDYKAPPYVKKEAFTDTEVEVGAGEWAVPGTLSLPVGNGPFPAVVLVHGSGPNDRDETVGQNKPFRDLAGGLASRGIAVLRFEKRTRVHGAKMVASKQPITVKEEVLDDVLSAVHLLRKQKGVDGKKIFVLGHSLGAVLAPKIGTLDPGITGLVILAGATRPIEDLVVEQFEYIFSLEGPLTDDQKAQIEKLKKQAARVKDPKLSPDTPVAELPLGQAAPYWLSLREAPPVETAAKVKQPMLILQGERDYQVTMTDFEGWKKGLANRKDVTLMSYPDLNHLFIEGKGKSKPAEYQNEGHVAVVVIDDVAGWIKKQ
jgi:dienelactone hydrolase